MISIKKEQDVVHLQESGRRLSAILHQLVDQVGPGVVTADLDHKARELIRDLGDKPAFLNYRPAGAKSGYPAALCVSINEEIVHGLPGNRQIQNGDVVTLDLGLNHQGYFTDMATTVIVGEATDRVCKLVEATKQALSLGIAAARDGNTTGDIGYAIESFIKPLGFGIIRDLSGHGVGYAVHEDPLVPNYGRAGQGTRLESGMVIAIEPMITLAGEYSVPLDDGFTFATEDGSISAHFEHTILITKDKPIILTK